MISIEKILRLTFQRQTVIPLISTPSNYELLITGARSIIQIININRLRTSQLSVNHHLLLSQKQVLIFYRTLQRKTFSRIFITSHPPVRFQLFPRACQTALSYYPNKERVLLFPSATGWEKKKKLLKKARKEREIYNEKKREKLLRRESRPSTKEIGTAGVETSIVRQQRESYVRLSLLSPFTVHSVPYVRNPLRCFTPSFAARSVTLLFSVFTPLLFRATLPTCRSPCSFNDPLEFNSFFVHSQSADDGGVNIRQVELVCLESRWKNFEECLQTFETFLREERGGERESPSAGYQIFECNNVKYSCYCH